MKLYFYELKTVYTEETGLTVTGFTCTEAEAKETPKCYCAPAGKFFPNGVTRMLKSDVSVGRARDGKSICIERDDAGFRDALVERYKRQMAEAEKSVRRYKAQIATLTADN